LKPLSNQLNKTDDMVNQCVFYRVSVGSGREGQNGGESTKLYILWRQFRTFVFIQRKSCIEKRTEK